MLIIFPLLFPSVCFCFCLCSLSQIPFRVLFVCVCRVLCMSIVESSDAERERERVLSLSSTSLNFPRLQRFSSTSLLFSSHSFLRLFFYCWRFVFLLSLYVILFSLFMHFRSSHNFIDFHFNSTDNFFFSTGFWCVFFPFFLCRLFCCFSDIQVKSMFVQISNFAYITLAVWYSLRSSNSGSSFVICQIDGSNAFDEMDMGLGVPLYR